MGVNKASDIAKILIEMNRLSVYRDILKEELVQKAFSFFESNIRNDKETEQEKYLFDLLYYMIGSKKSFHECDSFAKNIFDFILKNENTFSIRAGRDWDISYSLKQVVKNDIEILMNFATINFKSFIVKNEDYVVIAGNGKKNYEGIYSLFNGTTDEIVEKLINYYNNFGTGEISSYVSLKWEGNFEISGTYEYNNDPIKFSNIVGLNYQKELIYKNTESFVKGLPANNILLVGAGGTGKSSLVKASANEFSNKGLKILEIDRKHISDIDKVFKWIRERAAKFIVFMDDLSFEEYETDYKYLKSMLEGGVQRKPDNALVYVTSNRRHLIKEVWKDREENGKEVHETDSVNEKTSLSERFGITLHFMSSNQEEYLEIVRGIAKQRGFAINDEVLRREALQWSMLKNSRNGRAAKQFIDYMQGVKKI
ncbi:MAG: ATPase family associated with various cellular activities (AAA) [bacterium ADurb.Bin363]|nr:MAG: ATPase family associated with various cellular activities (AAA) [bacterium ADurb.Bin363]